MINSPEIPLPFDEIELEKLSEAIRMEPQVRYPDGGYYLRNWLGLVAKIQSEYSGVYDEFLDESWSRFTLEKALAKLNSELAKKFSDFLAPYDAQYLELTEPAGHVSHGTSIWLSRIPKRSPLLDEEEFKFWRVK